MSLTGYIYSYLLGGITFLPILLLCFIYLHPKVHSDDIDEFHLQEPLKAGEIEEDQKSGIKTYKSGWITVTQDYIESTDDITSTTQSINDSHDNKSAYSTLYKLVKNSDPDQSDANQLHHPPLNNIDGSNGGNNGNGENDNIKTNQKKHRFYGVLKHGNLFLYKNQTLKDVKHVIVLSNEFVTLWPRNSQDGQLFTKATTICLMKKNWSRTRRLSENFGKDKDKLTIDDILDPINDLQPPKSSFFIHCDTNIDKEDWYFALIRSSKVKDDRSSLSSNIYAKTSHFETNEMIDLISSLYSSEGQLQTKWFNALIGRVFLSLKRTEVLQSFLTTRISKKLNKIKTPGFLDKFKLGELDPGYSIPFFTYPDLKEISPNGTLIFTSYVHYHGSLSCNISTKVNLNFGSGRFTQRQVDVVLKVTLQKLEGPVIFKIKPPPSERLWYSFEIEPLMNLKIEPVISSRQMTYNIITSAIEKKFKDAIKESLVLPHWDDIVFHNTEGELFRGGIWDKSPRDDIIDPSKVKSAETSDSDSLLDPNIKSQGSSISDQNKDNKSDISIDPNNKKMKLTNTLSDLSKKIKKSKSSHTVSVNGDNWLSDGSLIEKDSNNSSLNSNISNQAKASIGKTWKKIGDWYTSNQNSNGSNSVVGNNDDKTEKQEYHKPEMISNRRRPRQQSNASKSNYQNPIPSSPSSSYEMFSKSTDLGIISHSRQGSKVSDNPVIDDSPITRHSTTARTISTSSSFSSNISNVNNHNDGGDIPFGEDNSLPVDTETESFPASSAPSMSDLEDKAELTYTNETVNDESNILLKSSSLSPSLKSSPTSATEESMAHIPEPGDQPRPLERSSSKLHRKAPPPL